MAITGPSSYVPTMFSFESHWLEANLLLGAGHAYLVRLADGNTTMAQAQFAAMRAALQAQQNSVQSCLTQQQVARGVINLQKTALLGQFALFASVLDAYFENTEFAAMRPVAPGFHDGRETFSRPLGEMMNLWTEINAGPAPAGVTLPLALSDGTTQGSFASALSALQFAYAAEEAKLTKVGLARAKRNLLQRKAYEAMKGYREGAVNAFRAFPELLATLPRLTPLPGHTPAAVAASAVFEAPDQTRVVYAASAEALLHSYQLRGNVGEHYDEADAVVLATHGPNDPREFVTPFGLTQPGARIALKVFVILQTENEAGSAPLLVERPLALPLAA